MGNPPAAGQPTSGGTAASTETNTVRTNSGATLNAAEPQSGNPTNALNDNRVALTTGNPLIESGTSNSTQQVRSGKPERV